MSRTAEIIDTEPRRLVRSVSRSLDLLEELAEPGEIGLVDLAQRTGLQPSTVHRLISTLVERGYVLQNPATGRYLIGYKLLELASSGRRARLCALARPFLASVQRVTGETANLTVLEQPNIVYLDQVEGVRSMRLFAQIARQVPAHTTASGKAILAYQDASVIGAMCSQGLEASTLHTLTRLEDLEDEFARIRRRGYAVDNEEQEEGVSCVAAPVFNPDGTVGAAISISAPTPRIERVGTAELGELIAAKTAELSRTLRHESVCSLPSPA